MQDIWLFIFGLLVFSLLSFGVGFTIAELQSMSRGERTDVDPELGIRRAS